MTLRQAALAAALVCAPMAAFANPTVGPAMDAGVIELSNDYRLSRGLSALAIDERLNRAAQAFADYYVAHPGTQAEWSHEYDGSTPFERAQAAGYDGRCVGENLGWQGTDGPLSVLGDVSEGMVNGWIASPPHHENLVHPEFDDIGVGSAVYESEGVTWVISVQMFGCSAP